MNVDFLTREVATVANKQVRITDQEHQLILLIRAVGVDLDKITGIVADMVIRKVTTAPQPEPEPEQEQEPEQDPQPEPTKILDLLQKQYRR